jgi:Immunoglobulin I-set domain
MDYKRQQNRRWFQKMLVFLVFGLFTAQAQAQLGILLPANIGVQPLSTNVQNGDTATFSASATCGGSGTMYSVQWFYNGQPISAANATVTTSMQSQTVTTTLTIKNVQPADAGAYSVQITDVLLNILGIIALEDTATSQGANLGIIPTVTAVATQTVMVNNNSNFKVQFSGPTGSNLVIQATSDMRNWYSISTNVIVNGSVTYTDAVSPTVSCRFYRAKLQ